MATLYSSSQFHRLTCKPHQRSATTSLNLGLNALTATSIFRQKVAVRLQVRQRLAPVFSINSGSSDGNAVTKKSDGVDTTNSSSSAQGPPFLTILAGFVVLFLLFWFFSSVVMWLISLVVNVPPSKR